MNPELICSLLYTVDATCPHGVGPVVARPVTHRRAISAVVARVTPVVARSQSYVPDRDPSLPDSTAIVARPCTRCCVPVVARPCTRCRLLRTHRRPNFFKLHICRYSDCYFRNRRRPVVPVVARCRPKVRTLPMPTPNPFAPAL